MINDKEVFLKWVENKYNVVFSDELGIIDKVLEWVELGKPAFDSSDTQDEKPKTDSDGKVLYGGHTKHFETEVDENGLTWYKLLHYHSTPEEARHIKVGDIIVYETCSHYDKDKKIYGTMLVGSFDFPGDLASRAYVGKSPWMNEDGTIKYTIYGDYAPCMNKFRFATEEEIKQFFDDCKEYDFFEKIYKPTPVDQRYEILMKRYGKYFNNDEKEKSQD